MNRLLILLSIFLFWSCASSQPLKNRGVLTVAVVGETIFMGLSQTKGLNGTFQIHSTEDDLLLCTGTFHYRPPVRGSARFSCSNGERGKIRIFADGYLSGTGKGSSSMGSVRVAFGYPLKTMNKLLDLPGGKKLIEEDGRVILVDDSRD